jgi:hypothetical protein
MRVATAFNKMLGLFGASVATVTFTPEGIVVGLRRRRTKHRCPSCAVPPPWPRPALAPAGQGGPDPSTMKVVNPTSWLYCPEHALELTGYEEAPARGRDH